jgi:hypothetical protein
MHALHLVMNVYGWNVSDEKDSSSSLFSIFRSLRHFSFGGQQTMTYVDSMVYTA